MERKIKISITEPCHEDWNKMLPDEKGKFCNLCSKSVIDFTTKSQTEISTYLIQNSDKKICGRFKKSQLDSLTIQIPRQIFYSQTQYHKIFLLALFISMGTILFSCTDKNGNKKNIEKIEVIDKPKEDIKDIYVGDIKLNHHDSLHKNIPPPPPPPPVGQIKFVKPSTIQSEDVISKKENSIEDEIYNGGISFEIDPEYDGGNEKFYDYFKKKFKLPLDASKKTGEIQISFVIDRNGILGHFIPIKDLGFGTMEETIRVLKNSKKWKPGEQNGKKTITKNILSLQIQNDSISKIKLNKY